MTASSPVPLARDFNLRAGAPFILELIVGDLHGNALHVGALAMIGAAAATEGGPSLKASRRLAFDEAAAMRLALRYAAGSGLSPGDVRALDRLYLDIQRTLMQLRPFLALDALSAAERELLRRVAPSLRRVALATAETIACIEPICQPRLGRDYLLDAAAICQFLARAGRGEGIEVGPEGVARLPQLRQRRKSPRLGDDRFCRLALPGGEVEATLVDISREGLGVSCKTPLAANQRLALRIEQRRLDVVVARVEGGRVGLRLERPLALNDPLFTEA